MAREPLRQPVRSRKRAMSGRGDWVGLTGRENGLFASGEGEAVAVVFCDVARCVSRDRRVDRQPGGVGLRAASNTRGKPSRPRLS